ncbi:MCE family protein [Nocardioides salsibiostraticola]
MLVNIHHDSKWEHNRLLLAGIVFLTSIALFIGLSIAIYNKAFTSANLITIRADRAGLQLAKFGDVRLNGALVGQVRSVEQIDQEAAIRVALEPQVEIPDNTEVEILPTTLFGQKYISFVIPDEPSETALADGGEIPSSRVRTNVELSQILANLFPLLRAVRPADLNMALNALDTALEGRGDQFGQTLVDLGEYTEVIDDSLPTLREDMIRLADVANTYDIAAPDLLGVLRNLTVTSRTVTAKRQELDVFFSDLSGLAETTTRVLDDNEANIIRVGEVTAPVLRLLAVYSPEFPCLIRGAAKYKPLLAKTFEGNEVKQFIEFGTAQYGPYTKDDQPVYGEVGHGPWCLGLPNPEIPAPPIGLDNGSDIDENPPTSPTPAAFQRPAPGYTAPVPPSGVASGYAGTEAEQLIINALLAGESGQAADSYGALGSLLYGPVVRGES